MKNKDISKATEETTVKTNSVDDFEKEHDEF